MATHPQVAVTVDGVPVSGVFFDRLISLTITDREGIQSDTLEMTFSDAPPHVATPRRGAVVRVDMAGAFLGAFVVDHVDIHCLPYTIAVKGHSADLRSGMKTGRNAYWDDASVKTIVAEKAADHGLLPKIAEAVSGHVYDYIAQQDESDLNFLNRLAARHEALFTIKNGALLWLERGAGKAADGAAVPVSVIPQMSILSGTCRMSEADVDRFRTVKAYWQDRHGATRQEVVVDADPEATGEHVLREPYSSQGEAEKAARAAARDMLRGSITTACAIEGRPGLMAGLPVQYLGVRPEVDTRVFILDTVKHSFTKSGGLRTDVTGKLRSE